MRIRELDIESFGVFRDRQMRFDPGLQIIYGPNEAGKTTLLQLIRQLLFGFPHRNAYSLDDHAGPLCAKATVAMQDGQRLWFRRRKGRPDKVVGELENNREAVELDDRLLTAMLGNATAELYDNVFGFSLDELAQGTASLREANLTDALYGSGVGSIANVQHVRAELEGDVKRLFNPRSKKSEIMQLLAQLQTDEQTWRESQVSPRQHREMLAEQVNSDQTADRLKEQLQSHRQAALRRQSISDAVPIFDEWFGLTQEMASLPPVPHDIDAETPARFEQLQKDLVNLNKAAAELQSKINSLDAALGKLPPDGAYAQHAETIQKLHQQVGQLHNDGELLPRRRQESESIRENVLRELQAIHPEWSSDSLNELQAGVEQRDAVQRLSEQRARLERSRTQCRTQLKELRRQEKRWRDVLDTPQSKVELLSCAEDLAHNLPKHRADSARLVELETELSSASTQLETLNETLGELEDWAQSPLRAAPPARESIDSFRSQFATLEKKLGECRHRVEHDQLQVAGLSEQLTELDNDAGTTEADLNDARAKRDEALLLVSQFFGAGEENTLERFQQWAGSESPWRRAHQLIEQVDNLTDELLRAADVVAQRAQLRERIANVASSLEKNEAVFQQAKTDLAAVEQKWRDEWSACGLTPAAPTRMLEWVQDYTRWCETSDQHQRLAHRVDQLRTTVANYRQQWRDLAAETGEVDLTDSATDVVQAGAAWHSSNRELIHQRDVAAKEASSIESRMAESKRELDAVELEDEQWAGEWAKLLGALGFPPHWEPALVQRVFQSLADAASRLRQADAFAKEAVEIQAGLQAAQAEVDSLVEDLGLTVAKMPVDAAITMLYASLEDERNGQRHKRELLMQREESVRRLTRCQDDEAKINAQVEQIRRALNVEDADEMDRRFDVLNRRSSLQSKVQDSQSRLAAISSHLDALPVEQFAGELKAIDREALAIEIKGDRVRAKELESELEQVQRRAGAATAALDKLTKSTAATDAARELASGRARLGQVVDSWAPLAMANQLLNLSMERFEKVNQPSLLQETSRLYAQLTGGRYVKVIRKLDDKQSIAVEDPFGNWKTAIELSTGAREQLYLAIRLAYVAEYCRRAEPLPIVMDDVLVNFDDDRAALALETLLECAQDQQVLFLTCHRRVMDLASAMSIPTITMKVRDEPVTRKTRKRKRPPTAPKNVAADNSDPDEPTQQDLFPRR